jgi:hypothetical protein
VYGTLQSQLEALFLAYAAAARAETAHNMNDLLD